MQSRDYKIRVGLGKSPQNTREFRLGDSHGSTLSTHLDTSLCPGMHQYRCQ